MMFSSVIEELAAGGMTMVMVTHEMAFARRIADQVVFMHSGRVWEQSLTDPQTPELKQFVQSDL